MSPERPRPGRTSGKSPPTCPASPIAETARELGMAEADILKLASNENPLGSSPKAIEALRGALGDLAWYPDGSGHDLKAAISAKLAVRPENIVLGNGSNDVLELVARAFLTPADSAVYSRHAFMVYPLVVQAIGARAIEVPAKDYGHDLAAMAAAIRPDTKIVFLANPNNPTGTFLAVGRGAGLRRARPADDARGDRRGLRRVPARGTASRPRAGWIASFPNLVVSRTLSKAYGLAGLRVGFGLAHPEVAELMNRVRQPFNVNHLAMVAACAALGDEAFIAKSRARQCRGPRAAREGLRAARRSNSFPPSGNFVAVRVGDAARIYDSLLREGVIVRPIAGYGMPEHLRVTVGTPAAERALPRCPRARAEGRVRLPCAA